MVKFTEKQRRCRNGLITLFGPITQEGRPQNYPSIISQLGNTPRESSEVALASNVSTSITALYSGPEVDTWAIDPDLPQGLQLSNGTIHGTPDHRQPWTDFTVWANNSGGSVSAMISLAIHDILADQQFLLNGMEGTSWNGWPSPILPIGEWSFPIAFSEGGYTSDIPVISASHVGKGKMIGYGHESWVHGSGGTEETEFALRAVRWPASRVHSKQHMAPVSKTPGRPRIRRAQRCQFCHSRQSLVWIASWMSSGTVMTMMTTKKLCHSSRMEVA